MNNNEIAKNKKLFIVLLPFLFLIQACTIPLTIKSEQIPELQGGSPLKGVKPIKFAVQNFVDERNNKDKDVLGFYRAYIIKIDKEVTQVVRNTIANELQRNGHEVVNQDASKRADIIIVGRIMEYWCLGHEISMWTIEVRGDVKVKITVINASNNKEMMTKTFSGFSNLRGGFIPPNRTIDVLNMALLNMVKDFTTDPDFINSIRINSTP